MKYAEVIEEIAAAETVVVIQAENPDGDSLASSLALESILSEQGKEVLLYCPVQMPRHLRFMSGWDRVENELPRNFDVSIIVDTSSASLLERVFTHTQLPRLRAKPTIVIDHHTNDIDMPYMTTNALSSKAAATSELIYQIAGEANWEIPLDAAEFMISSIMFDTLGLTSESATADTIDVVAALVRKGASIAKLDAARKKFNVKAIDLVRYKARLMQRIKYDTELGLAEITIPWEEIEEFSDRYNPSMLVMEEMRMTEGVKIAVAYKTYPDGKITAKIRANYGYQVADRLAEYFGGGGHPYAAGFKVRKQKLEAIQSEVRAQLSTLLPETEENNAAL